nr:DUF998 domain-containing protein [Rhodococcus sp. (in: high G+C Gram-positive bacteria)]
MTFDSPRAVRPATLGAPLIIAGALVVLALDIHTAVSDPAHLRRTISEYGLGAQQWVFATGVLLLAVGSACTLVAAVRSGMAKASSTAAVALTLWTVGLVAVVVVPKQDWSNDATLGLGGAIHRLGATLAFVSIPIALVAVSIPWIRDHRWKSWARATLGLAILGLAALLPIAYALVIGMTTSTPWYRVITLGYVERVLVVAEVTALISLALWVRATSSRSSALIS